LIDKFPSVSLNKEHLMTCLPWLMMIVFFLNSSKLTSAESSLKLCRLGDVFMIRDTLESSNLDVASWSWNSKRVTWCTSDNYNILMPSSLRVISVITIWQLGSSASLSRIGPYKISTSPACAITIISPMHPAQRDTCALSD